MSSYLISFLLFFLPFLILPFGISHFETPKVVVAEIIIIISFIAFLWTQKKFSWSMIPRPFVVLLLLCLYTFFFYGPSRVLFGNEFRLQGVLLLILLMLFSFISAKISFHPFSSRVILTILTVTLLTAIFIVGRNERAIGTLGEPNALAASVIFLWPFVFYKKLFSLKSFSVIAAIGITAMILFLSGSKSGMTAFSLQLLFFIVVQKFRWKVSNGLILVGILFCVSIVLTLFATKTLYENRIDIWASALYTGSLAPVFGNGIGMIDVSLNGTNDTLLNMINGYNIDSSHNIFLDWWVQGGVIGLGVLLFVIYKTFRGFLKKKDIFSLGLLIGVLTVMSFNPVSVVTLIAFWWLVGRGYVGNR